MIEYIFLKDKNKVDIDAVREAEQKDRLLAVFAALANIHIESEREDVDLHLVAALHSIEDAISMLEEEQ